MRRWFGYLKSDWVTAMLVAATAVVVALTFVGAVLLLPNILRSTNSVRDDIELTGCRSSYSADVTDARVAFDLARSERDTVDADADVILLELAEAAVFGDREHVDELRIFLAPLRDELKRLNDEVNNANAALADANDRYQEAVIRSRTDPKSFIASCEVQDL